MAKTDVSSRIKSYNTNRLSPFLKMKYDAMYHDPYRFFRGTTHLFFEDIPSQSFLFKSPNTWICGDLHLENYGSYKADNRVAYFNMNDFDECILAPCLLDVVRMLTSIYVASSALGITPDETHNLTELFTYTYFNKLQEGYIRVLEKETTKGVTRDFLTEMATRKRKNFLNKRTIKKEGGRKLLIDEEHTTALPTDEKKKLISTLNIWAKKTPNPGFYKVLDIAYRIAGTSSLGLKRYVLLVEGNGSPNENYILEIKETRKSCLEKYNNVKQPLWTNEAQRIIEVQRRVLSDPPALLNNITIDNCNFVMKELQPEANRINYSLFKGNKKKIKQMLEDMACIYAWSNLRSSGRQGSGITDDFIKFASEKKDIKNELVNYAFQYSKAIFSYHKSFCEAFNKGHFKL